MIDSVDEWLGPADVIEVAIKTTLAAPGPHRCFGVGVADPSSIDGLVHLARLTPPGSTLVELGSAWGESTMFFWLCGRFKHIYAVDPYIGLDHDNFDNPSPLIENVVRPSKGVVEHIRKTSTDAAVMFEDASLDIVYIDAVHDYKHVSEDIRAYLPKVKHGGIIAGHDYNAKLFPGTIQAVDEILGKPDAIYTDTSWMKRVI